MNLRITKTLVKNILENPGRYEWSVQGLGMMRTYISRELRLHIWDDRLEVPGASRIHDHPWSFVSYVVAGAIRNNVFIEDRAGLPYKSVLIHCGAGGCVKSDPVDVKLHHLMSTVYEEGRSYSQNHDELHDTSAERGTVTLVERYFDKEDTDHAKVYFPAYQEWGSAEPRPATKEEIEMVISNALKRF
jgi:hypothetical protein